MRAIELVQVGRGYEAPDPFYPPITRLADAIFWVDGVFCNG